MHESKLIFVRAGTFGQMTEQVFTHESSGLKLEKPVPAWRFPSSSSKSKGNTINVVQRLGQITAQSRIPAPEILSHLSVLEN